MKDYSIAPDNKKYALPTEDDTKQEINKIKKICIDQRKNGKKIVVVQGLGFVGAVMGAIIADAETNNKTKYFVIGIDLPTQDSFWKIPTINNGKSPFKAKDSDVDDIFQRTIIQKNNYIASWVSEAFAEADIIVVDINLDVVKTTLGHAEEASVSIESFKKAMETIGNNMRKNALIVIETTIPPGTVENIVKPTILRCFEKRGINVEEHQPLLAHSYERVMPGEHYIDSIKRMQRTFSAVNKQACEEVQIFLNDIIETDEFPLWKLDCPSASEMAKVMENSYRAMNIALIYEWTLFAEDIGVNLFDIVDSIKVRKGTHDNMMYPGFGVGGYCLTKDPLLAEWGSKTIFKRREKLTFSVDSVDVNDLMPHHTFELLKKGMKNNIKNKKIVILGASYRKNIDDTRNSPTIILFDDILKYGGKPVVHDPFAISMIDREDISISTDIDKSLENANAVVFVVDHDDYLNISVEKIIEKVKLGGCIVDAFNILSDEKVNLLIDRGYVVLGVGKGHINKRFGDIL